MSLGRGRRATRFFTGWILAGVLGTFFTLGAPDGCTSGSRSIEVGSHANDPFTEEPDTSDSADDAPTDWGDSRIPPLNKVAPRAALPFRPRVSATEPVIDLDVRHDAMRAITQNASMKGGH